MFSAARNYFVHGLDTPAAARARAYSAATPWTIVFAAIFSAQLGLIWSHEPWHDELHAALLARDTHGFAAWWWNFRYEGHAPFYHLLLKSALLAVDEVTALRLVQTLLALGTAWLLFVRSPFPMWMRALIGLNYFVFFEYGVIARDYSIGLFCFFGALAFRDRWFAWLFIALLPQAGLQCILLAGVLGWVMLCEGRWSWSGAAIATVGAALGFVWILPAPDVETIGATFTTYNFILRFIRAFSTAGMTMFPVDLEGQLTGWTAINTHMIATTFFAGLLMPWFAVWSVRRLPSLRIMCALFIATTFLIAIYSYALFLRHYGLIVILVLGCLWIENEKGMKTGVATIAWMCLLAVGGVAAAGRSLVEPFSTARATAAYVEQLAGPDTLIIPTDTMLGVEISAYTNRLTLNMTNQCMQTFVQWKGPVHMMPGSPHVYLTPAQDEAWSRQFVEQFKAAAARAGGRAILVMGGGRGEFMSMAPDEHVHYRKFIATDNYRSTHARFIYEVIVPPAPDARPWPRCVP